MTVSSFTSVSLEPPLILVCLFKEAETVQSIMESQTFGVSLLSVNQADVSTRFAGGDPNFPEETNRFLGLETMILETGSPLLKGALAHLDCRVWKVHDGGTHHIFIGEVVASQINSTDSNLTPLVYSNQGYHRLMPPSEDYHG
jgi:flavin reductase (DIM6/NTAB) family NADH-FMN oxidoreductase RutF